MTKEDRRWRFCLVGCIAKSWHLVLLLCGAAFFQAIDINYMIISNLINKDKGDLKNTY